MATPADEAAGEGDDGGGRDESGDRAVSPGERRYEIVATVLLAVAALATAWSGYQASLWDGICSSPRSPGGSSTRGARSFLLCLGAVGLVVGVAFCARSADHDRLTGRITAAGRPGAPPAPA